MFTLGDMARKPASFTVFSPTPERVLTTNRT